MPLQTVNLSMPLTDAAKTAGRAQKTSCGHFKEEETRVGGKEVGYNHAPSKRPRPPKWQRHAHGEEENRRDEDEEGRHPEQIPKKQRGNPTSLG
eukprot:7985809-Pyramimonas_sp.AAC.1